MHRRQILQRLAAAGLLSGGIMGYLQRALAAGTNPVPPGLHALKGQVLLNGQPAREGALVNPGDTITTGGDGEALYVIGDNAFLQRSGSTVSFGKTAADFMRVLSGRILSVFGKGERTLRFSTATIGIRGTACYIESEHPDSGMAKNPAYFCLCYGEAEIVPSSAPQEREIIKTTHHDRPLYISDDMKMPKMTVPATVVNHSDAELTLLENLVGRLPPFGGSSGYRY